MKRLVVAGALALGLLAASPGSAAASSTWCTWDPLVPIVTPGGHLVVVYDSVWTPSLLNLGVPLESYSTRRAYDSNGNAITEVDMAISTPTGLLLSYSTMDEVTTGLLGSGGSAPGGLWVERQDCSSRVHDPRGVGHGAAPAG
jgi:hypothetical protein